MFLATPFSQQLELRKRVRYPDDGVLVLHDEQTGTWTVRETVEGVTRERVWTPKAWSVPQTTKFV